MPDALARKRASKTSARPRYKTSGSKAPPSASLAPRASASLAPPSSTQRPKPTTLPPSRGRVLVIDDDPIVLQSLSDCLSAAGFRVTVRSQALGTSQWITQNEVDLILIDLVMPAMSGIDLAMFLKKRGLTRKLSVILHSEDAAMTELGPLVRQSGALGAIPKTGDRAQFLAEFERLAERHFRTKEVPDAAKKAAKP